MVKVMILDVVLVKMTMIRNIVIVFRVSASEMKIDMIIDMQLMTCMMMTCR